MPRHLYVAIHHPRTEHMDDFVVALAEAGSRLEDEGAIDASVWRSAERIVATSIWESPDALGDALPTLLRASPYPPLAAWEARPRTTIRLDQYKRTDPTAPGRRLPARAP